MFPAERTDVSTVRPQLACSYMFILNTKNKFQSEVRDEWAIVLFTFITLNFFIFYYFSPLSLASFLQPTPSQRASCCAGACSLRTLCPTGVLLWPWLMPCRTTWPRRSSCLGFNSPPAWATPRCLCCSSAPTSSPRYSNKCGGDLGLCVWVVHDWVEPFFDKGYCSCI